MKEIVYREGSNGQFERIPTRAEKRAADRLKAERAGRIQVVVTVVLLAICAAIIIGANIATLGR